MADLGEVALEVKPHKYASAHLQHLLREKSSHCNDFAHGPPRAWQRSFSLREYPVVPGLVSRLRQEINGGPNSQVKHLQLTCAKDLETKGDHLLAPLLKVDQEGKTERSKIKL